MRGVCCKRLEAICGHYWPAMSGNCYELNSLAWIAGGSTLKAQAGSVLVVVITTRGASTGTGRLDAVEVFVDVAANLATHTCRQPLAVADAVSN